MSKCLAAGQAEKIINIYISSSSFESLKVLSACWIIYIILFDSVSMVSHCPSTWQRTWIVSQTFLYPDSSWKAAGEKAPESAAIEATNIGKSMGMSGVDTSQAARTVAYRKAGPHENLETSKEQRHFSLTVAKIQTNSMSSKTWALQEVCIRSRHCIWSKRRGGAEFSGGMCWLLRAFCT